MIEGEKQGQIGINGPAALKMKVGHVVIVVAYAFLEQSIAKHYSPTIIFPNEETNLIN